MFADDPAPTGIQPLEGLALGFNYFCWTWRSEYFTGALFAETEMSLFWWNFTHWVHWKFQCTQWWQHFHFSACRVNSSFNSHKTVTNHSKVCVWYPENLVSNSCRDVCDNGWYSRHFYTCLLSTVVMNKIKSICCCDRAKKRVMITNIFWKVLLLVAWCDFVDIITLQALMRNSHLILSPSV